MLVMSRGWGGGMGVREGECVCVKEEKAREDGGCVLHTERQHTVSECVCVCLRERESL